MRDNLPPFCHAFWRYFLWETKKSVCRLLRRKTEADMIIIISLVDNQQIPSLFDRSVHSSLRSQCLKISQKFSLVKKNVSYHQSNFDQHLDKY